MSAKRPATHELTHENWDRDEEPEERGTFRLATQNEMKNRVIKKAKRKCNNDSLSTDDSNSGTKSIFGGFTGFGKQSATETDTASATSSPFAFLSKLSSNTQSTTTAASPFASSSNIFSFSVVSSTPSSSTLSSGLNKSTEITSVSSTTSSDDVTKLPNTSSLFSMTKTTETTKTTEIPNSNTFSFGGSTQTTVPKTTFSFAKIPEKPATSTTSSTSTLNSPKTTFSFGSAKAADTLKSSSPPSTSTFSSTLNVPKSTFSLSNIKPTTNATFSFASTSPTKSQSNENANNAKQESKASEMESNGSKEEYCGKLKALNIAVSEWIKMHVDKNPLCVLTPIFKDYEKYLQQIEQQKEKNESIKSSNVEKGTFTSTSTTISNIQPTSTTFSLGNASPKTVPPSPTTSAGNKTNGFSFGLNVDSKTDSKPVSTGFGFDVKSPNPPNTSSTSPTKSFTFTPTSTPFSFGNIKPPESTPATVKDDDDDDEPPKVEFKQVMEENAIYSKKCKVFVKKDGNYVDKGVGTLYLKPVDSSDKTQLLVRADTNLGNILVNLILSASIPTKKMGKNNVMMVCVPSPDISKPTSMLLRVKTADEADELLEKIEMYKK